MSYELSFSPDFFWGDGSTDPGDMQPSPTPSCVYQALLSMEPEKWAAIARDVFGVESDSLDADTVLGQILDTNTCRNLDPPVEVFIDAEGFYTVLVY